MILQGCELLLPIPQQTDRSVECPTSPCTETEKPAPVASCAARPATNRMDPMCRNATSAVGSGELRDQLQISSRNRSNGRANTIGRGASND